jgi:hypothetical protein
MEIIKADRGPQINIHFIERTVHGSGIGIKVYGEMKIAAGEVVYAKELKLNTIEVLTLTPEVNKNTTVGYIAQKYIYNKGAYDNYASIDIYDTAGTWLSPGRGPVDGSIWLNFIALGE